MLELTIEDLIECIRDIAQENLDAVGTLSHGAVVDAVTLVNERGPAHIPEIKTEY